MDECYSFSFNYLPIYKENSCKISAKLIQPLWSDLKKNSKIPDSVLLFWGQNKSFFEGLREILNEMLTALKSIKKSKMSK